MKYLAILLLTCGLAKAQKVDYNAIILPKTATDIDFSEKLVQLAWQNSPTTEILNRQINTSNLRIKQARWSFIEKIGVTGNLNEFNISKSQDGINRSQFYPRYNVFASINLGTLFTDPLKTKIEKQGLQIAIQTVNQQKLMIRSEVLAKYQVYLSNKEIYDIRNQILNDTYLEFQSKEQSFRRGAISLSDYNMALDRYNQQKIEKVQAEKDFLIARIELEELIGMKLTDVH